MITAEQFESEYACASGVTVARLREMGRIVRPCDCGYESCKGWQSVSRDNYDPLPARDPEWEQTAWLRAR